MSAPRRSGETGTTAATRTACPRPAIPATAIAVERREETPRQASPRQEQGGGHRRPPRQQTPWTHHPRARSSGSRASRSRRCTTGGSGESSDDATKIRRRHSSTDAPPLRPLQRHPYLQNAVSASPPLFSQLLLSLMTMVLPCHLVPLCFLFFGRYHLVLSLISTGFLNLALPL
jgi:hypothetical protein